MKSAVVLDANIILKWVLRQNEESVAEAATLHDLILKREITALVPELALSEAANVMFWKKGFVKQDIIVFLDVLQDGRLTIVPFFEFDTADILDVMQQYRLSDYDACCVCLAKKNNCKILSLDKRILAMKDIAVELVDVLGQT